MKNLGCISSRTVLYICIGKVLRNCSVKHTSDGVHWTLYCVKYLKLLHQDISHEYSPVNNINRLSWKYSVTGDYNMQALYLYNVLVV